MGDRIGLEALGVFGDVQGLTEPFGADAERIGIVLQDVAIDEVSDDPVIVTFDGIDGGMAGDPQAACMCLDRLEFGRGKSAGVHDDAVYLVSLVFGEVFHAEGGIQSTAEAQYYFL